MTARPTIPTLEQLVTRARALGLPCKLCLAEAEGAEGWVDGTCEWFADFLRYADQQARMTDDALAAFDATYIGDAHEPDEFEFDRVKYVRGES